MALVVGSATYSGHRVNNPDSVTYRNSTHTEAMKDLLTFRRVYPKVTPSSPGWMRYFITHEFSLVNPADATDIRSSYHKEEFQLPSWTTAAQLTALTLSPKTLAANYWSAYYAHPITLEVYHNV